MWFGLEDVTLYDWTHLCKKNFTSEPCDLSLIDLHSEATKICTGTRQSCSSLIPHAHQPHIVFHRPWHSDVQVEIPPQGCSPLCSPITTPTDFFHSDTHSVWCCSGCQMGGSLHCAGTNNTTPFIHQRFPAQQRRCLLPENILLSGHSIMCSEDKEIYCF